jgi:predicted murein hydrolase (TIGR00659 family)
VLSLISLCLTIAVYWICQKIYTRWRWTILNPMLTSLVVLVFVVSLARIPYSAYMGGAHVLTFMLSPATVAFAIPLYKHFHLLKKHALEIVTGLCLGSVVAIVTSVLFARTLDLGHMVTDSLAPRSVTTPIAMQISQQHGGSPVLTSVFVIVTALVGLVVGPLSIRWFRIQSAVAKGMLMGMGAHGIGTSRAFEFGQLEGTFSSLSMIVAAGFTVLFTPLLLPLLQ